MAKSERMLDPLRTLDVDVESLIFGRAVHFAHTAKDGGLAVYTVDHEWLEVGEPYTVTDAGHVWPVPHYSTFLPAAWLVLERMELDGYQATIECNIATDNGYGCHFWKDGNGWYSAIQPTVEQAICRAAWSAKKGE